MALSAPNLFRATTQWVYTLAIQNTPPGGPAVDDRYIVGLAPVGAWAGQANSIARWNGAAWVFSAPSTATSGWAAYVAAERSLYGWSGAAWSLVLSPTALGVGPAFLHWGSNAVAATTTTRYMPPGYDSALASLTAIQYRMPAACRLRNLRVRHNVTAGNGNAIVYTVRKNGAPTALSASLASTAADASDLVNVIDFAAGDLLDIEVTKAASVGTSPNDILAIVEVIPP